ncbi:aconitase X [Paenarthrobacter sp. NPDC058040]|uniref:aconitase X n=1 Tax=unclassified Paenarthrobacter TaxID=2634190 RepID=UPI0036D79F5C
MTGFKTGSASASEDAVQLSREDKRMLAGNHGEAAQIAMRIILAIARIQGARRLIDISHVHIGGSIYTGEGSLRVIRQLTQLGAKVRVPTTINAISIDRKRWRDRNIEEEFAAKADELASAFEAMGARPIFSCTPYVYPDAPKYGQDILWAESNAITYANSVIGARTNRHGDFMDVCAAITGRVPQSGLHMESNRVGNFLVRVPAVQNPDGTYFATLGYLIGKHTGQLVPVIDGIRTKPSLEDLKAFSSTITTSGAVGLFHMVGITPEAETVDAALQGLEPLKILDVELHELEEVWADLSTGSGKAVSQVVLGSPHFTFGEFVEMAAATKGKTKNHDTTVLVTTSRFTYEKAKQAGLLQTLEDFGATVNTDTCLCMLNPSSFPESAQTVMTNSGKFAHYGPGLTSRGVYFGSINDCVESAVAGTLRLSRPKWLEPFAPQ